MSESFWQRVREGVAHVFSTTSGTGPIAATFGGSSAAGERVTPASALTLSTVWACIRLRSGTLASLPVEVQKKVGPDIWEQDEQHPLSSILHDSPNADQSALDFWQFMNVSLDLRGNAFAEKNRLAGRVIGLTPYAPDAVTVRRNSVGVLEYRVTDGRTTRVLASDDIFHIRGFGGDPLGGLSPLHFGRQTFGLAIATEKAAAQIVRNGLRPSGVLETKDGAVLKAEQRNDIYAHVIEKFGGDNNGKPLLLEAGLSWKALTITAADAQMIESRHFSVEDGCRWFRVPPHMVGHTAGNTQLGSSIEQQTLGFLIFSLREEMKRIEQAIAKQLLTPAERLTLRIKINFEALLRADSAGRAAFYTAMVQNGIMTRNEVRRIEGLPPIDGGDALTIQSNMIPADRLGDMTSTADQVAKNAFLDWLGHNGGPKLES